MKEQKKEFTGVWIPKEVLEDKNLNATDKLLYMEIASFPVCYMFNRTLAEKVGCSERTITDSIKRMVEGGYLAVLKSDGRNRYIKAIKDFYPKSIVVQDPIGTDLRGNILYADSQVLLHRVADSATHSILDNNIDNSIELAETVVSAESGIDGNDFLIKKTKKGGKSEKAVDPELADPRINKIIALFQDINKDYASFYANNTQRRAVGQILKIADTPAIEKALECANYYNKDPKTMKAWAVYTPLDLKKNWSRLEDYVASNIIKKQTEKPKAYFSN